MSVNVAPELSVTMESDDQFLYFSDLLQRFDMVDLNPHPDRLRINVGNITACAPNWSWSTAGLSWTDLDMWVVLDGVGHMETPGRTGGALAGIDLVTARR